MRFGVTGAVALVLVSVAPAQATDPAEPAERSVRPTEQAASYAVGIFCVPVLIAGKLPTADLIKASRFTAGTQPHAKPPSKRGFSLQIDNGDVVEVFVDERKHTCTIHIHGAATAIDDYRAALRAQNWQQFIAPSFPKSSTEVLGEGWRVSFPAPIGTAVQIVGSRSSITSDADAPQVNAGFLIFR